MYLIFDSSANGRPKSYKAPLDDSFAWPRLMHLSWIVLNEELKPIEDYNCLIKPHGYKPSDENLKRHGIDKEKLETTADGLVEVLEKFAASMASCDFVFAHNLQFNEGIVGAEYYRESISSPLISADKYCLMQEATYYCKLPGRRGYKWPSLQEMHSTIFKQGYSPSNHARADVIAASRCFIFLKKSGNLDDIFFEE